MRNSIAYIAVLILVVVAVIGYAALRSGAGTSTGSSTTTAQTSTVGGRTTVSTSTTIPQTTTVTLTGSLQAYWKFDEGSGSTAYDSSGNGNTGTLVNSPAWVPGKLGDALSFNGRNQYVSTNYYGVSGGHARTFIAWVKVSGACYNPVCDILTYGSEESGARIEWSIEGNGVGLRAYESYIVYSAPNVSDGKWHQLAMVIPQNAALVNILVYEDGQLLDTVSESQFATSPIQTGSAKPVNIGRMYAGANIVGNPAPNGAAYFNGSIDDLRIYNIALNASQISGLASS
ncbi:MAG: LamG domain-containing protein [Candidatus Micrarchaeota archaeon]|nr:LamG domain-containing protein [Candidatus Micrarchaeota archaeon]